MQTTFKLTGVDTPDDLIKHFKKLNPDCIITHIRITSRDRKDRNGDWEIFDQLEITTKEKEK
jgi:hypothetical protein